MHERSLIIGTALYLAVLLASAAGWSVVEEWLETTPTDALTELRALLTGVGLVLTATWIAVRHRLETVLRCRSR